MQKMITGLTTVILTTCSTLALADTSQDWSLHGFGDVSVKNYYITPRGLVVTTKGAAVQVLNGLVLVSPGGIAFHAGTWTDLNPGYSKADGNISALNEFDFFAGVSGDVAEGLTVGVEYSQFISGQPSVAFHDERNIEFSLKYADKFSESFSFNPYAKFFWAVDGDSTVVRGKKGGTFDVELGLVPAYKISGITLSAPTWVTVGPENYWGGDQNFGVISTGLKVAAPLSFIKGAASLSVYGQAQYYHLINDNLVLAEGALNSRSDTRNRVVFSAGLSMGF